MGWFMVRRIRTRWAGLVACGALLASIVGAAAETAPAALTYEEAAAQCEAATDAGVCLRFSNEYAGKYSDPAAQAKTVVFYEGACALGNANACHSAGEAYAAGKINRSANALLVRDDALAAKYFRLGCEAGSPYACDGIGQLMIAGRAAEPEPGAALAAFEKGCNLEDYVFAQAGSCLALGRAYSAGGSRPADPALAMRYIEKGCSVINAATPAAGAACVEAGRRFEFGAEGVERFELAALNRYETACTNGDQDGCRAQKRLASGEAGQEQRMVDLAADQAKRAAQAPVCEAIWQESRAFLAAADVEGDALLAESDRQSAASDNSKDSRLGILTEFEMATDALMGNACARLLDFRYRAIMACSSEDAAAISEALLADARAAQAAMSNRVDAPQSCRIGLQSID